MDDRTDISQFTVPNIVIPPVLARPRSGSPGTLLEEPLCIVTDTYADGPIIRLLKECIPAGSSSILEEAIHKRSKYPVIGLKSDSSSMRDPFCKPEAVWEQVERLRPSEQAVLVIEDINDEWCEALCNRFPESINQRFVLEHILALNTNAPWKIDDFYHPDDVERSVAADLERLHGAFPCLSDFTMERFGRHIDLFSKAKHSEPRGRRACGYLVRLTSSGWIKQNSFLSYCELAENIYLILTASIPRPDHHTGDTASTPRLLRTGDLMLCMDLTFPNEHDRMRLNDRDRYHPHEAVGWDLSPMFWLVWRVFEKQWPFFSWKFRAGEEQAAYKQKHVNGFLLIFWIMARVLQKNVEKSESDLMTFAYLATEDDRELFTELTKLRRGIGTRYSDLERSDGTVEGYLERSVTKSQSHRGHFSIAG